MATKVQIQASVTGFKQIQNLQTSIKQLQPQIDKANAAFIRLSGATKDTLPRIATLNQLLKESKREFDRSVLGTQAATTAAKNLVSAERAVNNELARRNALLNKVRGNQASAVDKSIARNQRRRPKRDSRSGFASFSRDADEILLQGQSSPVGGKIERTLQLKQDEKRLQEALLALEKKQAVIANEKLQTRLELNRQTVQEVNNVKNQVLGGRGIGPGQVESVFKNRVLENTAESKRIREIAATGSNRMGMMGGFKEFNKRVKEIQADTKKMRGVITQSGAQFAATAPFGVAGGNIGPALPPPRTLLNNLGFGVRANPQGPFASSKGRSGRIAGAASNALIGGGFPLLFGQGALGAAGGGIGGAVGGALGGPFGFGLSIAGTAIATRIQETIDFRKAVDDLNVAIKATGGTSVFTARQVTQFANSLGLSKQEALEALKAFKQFEASARITLSTVFGSESVFDTLAGLKDNASIIKALPGLSKELLLSQTKQALEILKTKDAREAEIFILNQIIDKNKEIIKQEGTKSNLLDKLNPFRGTFKRNDPNSAFFGLAGGGGFQSVEELEESRGVEAGNEFSDKIPDAKELLNITREFNAELERQAILKAPVDEFERLIDPLQRANNLSIAISDSFETSFLSIVKGTKSVERAFGDMLNGIADHFFKVAAKLMANKLQQGILGLLTSGLGGGGGLANNFTRSVARQTPTLTPQQQVSRFTFGRARGGPVTKNGSFVVGEKGPELFVPKRSGTIIPNDKLAGGGSTNISVNVDASGSSVQSNEQQGKELGRVISAAIQSELIKQRRPGGLLR